MTSRSRAAAGIIEPSTPQGLEVIELIEYATAQPQDFGAVL